MPMFRQAFRSLLQTPAFAFTALVTVALGVGANTAVYAVIHAVLFQPLPFRQPGRLVQIWETHPELPTLQVAVPDYLDWKNSLKTLDVAAYTFEAMDKGTLLRQGEPIAVQATNASSDLFPLLGIHPLIGRFYTSDDEKSKRPVAVISERLWRQKFSASPAVIGRALRLDTTSLTIIGVLPSKNLFPVWADVWLPLSLTDPEFYSTRKYHPLEVIGRVKPGVPLQQAEVEVETAARRLSRIYPATNGKIGALTIPLLAAITDPVRPALIATWIAVALVFLIACANLAHLMLSRALERRHEVALRLALGASRFRAVRAFLLETCLLGIAGGLSGVLVANITLPAVQYLAHGQVPRLETARVNLAVVLFGLLASLAMSFVFALPSYLGVFRSDLGEAISSANSRSSLRRGWLSPVMMGSEVALALAVVLAAMLLLRSFYLTLQTSPGFQPAHVLAVHTPLIDRDWAKSYQLLRNRIAPALHGIPGVEQVAAVNSVPMSLGPTEHSRYATRFGIAGKQFEPGRFPTAQIRWCTPNYFAVLGIPLLRGRFLNDSDHGQPRYLINETFARRFFPHSDPVGQKILLGVVTPHPESDEIVGIVGDVHEFGLTSAPEPTMYFLDVSPEMDVVVKTSASDTAVQNAISAIIRRLNPERALGPVRALNSYVTASLAAQRFVLALIATFAGLAICLCIVGVYGVFSYSVTRRMREFGIRAAIGAGKRDLAFQIIKECLTVIVPGALAGLALFSACSQSIRSLLYRVSPGDTLSSALAVLCVVALCLLSVLVPAHRAAKVDPATMLREQ